MKRALITVITGQDGSYLAELLLEKGYEVHGMVRRVALEDPQHRLLRIRHLAGRLHLHSASLDSYASVFDVFQKVKPDECYHLAAQSFVSYSFEDEFSTINTNINGTHFVLSSLKHVRPECRFYFAASSEMFGKVAETPQTEKTPFHPRSPYGIHASSGILFNHESPRRGYEFVTRKITNAVARIKLGLERELRLGNLDARRDWGYAQDYVAAMWLMLQQDVPDDYVVATGETHDVRDFVATAFAHVGLKWQDYVKVDDNFYRPAEVQTLTGDASKARRALGWKESVRFRQLVEMMVENDLKNVREGVATAAGCARPA